MAFRSLSSIISIVSYGGKRNKLTHVEADGKWSVSEAITDVIKYGVVKLTRQRVRYRKLWLQIAKAA